MTRIELLKILVGQARANGFEFRRWFTTRLHLEWNTADDAFELLATHRHYYSLLFSHDFAQAFWQTGSDITFQIPASSFQRRLADGTIATVQRKAYMRRTARPDVWRYHLREMALSPEPLRYIRRYLHVEDNLAETDDLTRDAGPLASRIPTIPPTLAFARRARERREHAAQVAQSPDAKKRSPRLPGSGKAKPQP